MNHLIIYCSSCEAGIAAEDYRRGVHEICYVCNGPLHYFVGTRSEVLRFVALHGLDCPWSLEVSGVTQLC